MKWKIKSNLIWNSLMIMTLFMNSCTKDSGPVFIPKVHDPNDSIITISFAEDVQEIFDGECWFCHPANGDLDLGIGMSHAELVNVEAANYSPNMRVVPYDTAASVLYHKIIDDNLYGLKMPPGALNLTVQEKAIITTWILEGALDN